MSGYENGSSEPKIETIAKIISILDIDANFLWRDEMDSLGDTSMDLSYKEMNHMKKYRNLDNFGRETVDIILNRELHRVEQLKQETEFSEELSNVNFRTINYFCRLVSAGTGQIIFDTPPSKKYNYQIRRNTEVLIMQSE